MHEKSTTNRSSTKSNHNFLPEIPDLDEVVRPAIETATMSSTDILFHWTLDELGCTNESIGISRGEAGTVDWTTDSDARHGRVGSHRVPDEHLAVGTDRRDKVSSAVRWCHRRGSNVDISLSETLCVTVISSKIR